MKKILLGLLFITINLYGENQTSSDLVIDNGKALFKLKRESSFGVEIITVSSTTDKYFYIQSGKNNSSYNSSVNYEYNGDETDSEILTVSATRGFNSIYQLNRVSIPFSNTPQTLDLILVCREVPGNSYNIKLKINPQITIPDSTFDNEEKLKKILESNPSYKRYFYSLFIGSGLFIPTEESPIPSSIDMRNKNNLILDYKSNLVVDSTAENTLFNSIYNNSFSNSSMSGFSIINKILNLYYKNGKPIFHSFINDLVEDGKFNYTEYSLLSRDEGELLVKAALKYLTWGVEYTPSVNRRDLDSKISIFPSKKVKNSKTLSDWIKGENSEESNNTNNYYSDFSPSDGINNDDPTYTLEEIVDIETITRDLNLTTPFNNITGSSIPYAKGGIDSPRTFNYKMGKQMDILDRYLTLHPGFSWYGSNNNFSITNIGSYNLSAEKFYFRSWESFIDLEIDQPYFPGYIDGEAYKGGNITGVDGVGLLTGSIAMTKFYDKILGINNSLKPTSLDNLYKMEGETSNELLKFKTNSIEDVSSYRLSNNDIEKSTVIVPNLKDVQPGDLLVSTDLSEPEIGIVVKNNYKNGSFKFKDIIVISSTKKAGRVSLQYWNNSDKEKQSFTNNPKSFLVRRLLKFNGDIESPNNYIGEDLWDPFEYTPLELATKLDIYNKFGKWIPNTGELLLIDGIKFLETNEGTTKKLEISDVPVTIVPPTDLNYDSTDPHKTNINNNMGSGFEFFAVRRYIKGEINYSDYIKLATIRLNKKNVSGNNRYTIEYDNNIFQIDGITKDNYKLVYNGDKLEFSCGDIKTTTFGIRPLSDNIRPGDDIVLNFSLNINGNPNLAAGNNSDFLGVYDKKMIWRANLYIDDGAGDWNNLNKWNAPSDLMVSNMSGPFTDGNSVVTIKEAASKFSQDYNKCFITDNKSSIWYGPNEWNINGGGGGQVIEIDSFTYNPHITVKKADGVVAYSYGGSDSPFEFNSKMEAQRFLLRNEFNIDGFKYKNSRSDWKKSVRDKENFNGVDVKDYIEFVYDYNRDLKEFPSGARLMGVWNKTLSPGSYNDYIYPSEVFSNIKDTETPYNSDLKKLQSVENFPFVPGWALWYWLENKKVPPNWVNGISAGVDCIGFATRSASYLGNDYAWGDGRSQDIKDSRYWYVYVNYPYYKNVDGKPVVSELITKKNAWGERINLDKVKPGDILYQEFLDGSGKHIAIVLNVIREGNLQSSNIKLIESTWTNDLSKARILNFNSAESYNSKKYNWVITRLNSL